MNGMEDIVLNLAIINYGKEEGAKLSAFFYCALKVKELVAEIISYGS